MKMETSTQGDPEEAEESTRPRAMATLFFVWVVANVICAGCSKSPSAMGDAGGDTTSLSPADAAAHDAAPSDRDAAVTGAGPDADPVLPAEFTAAAPPDVTCSDQTDAAACDLPPSICAQKAGCDAGASACSSAWIAYYENPRCVAGHCVWDQSYFLCVGSGLCRGGACAPNSTAIP